MTWHSVVVQLLQISLKVIWENLIVEGNAFTDTMIQKFKNVGGDEGAYKDRGVGRLLLNCSDGLQSDNKKLRSINKKL